MLFEDSGIRLGRKLLRLLHAEFVIDFGALMDMLSKRDLRSGELETLRISRNAITVVTANGEVQTNEETQVFVHDLHLFVTVQSYSKTRLLS